MLIFKVSEFELNTKYNYYEARFFFNPDNVSDYWECIKLAVKSKFFLNLGFKNNEIIYECTWWQMGKTLCLNIRNKILLKNIGFVFNIPKVISEEFSS